MVVNFGDAAFTLPDGQLIRPRDYAAYRVAAGSRQYSLPPCPNVFATP